MVNKVVRVVAKAPMSVSRNDGGSGGNDLREDIGEGEGGGGQLTSNVNFIIHCIHTLITHYLSIDAGCTVILVCFYHQDDVKLGHHRHNASSSCQRRHHPALTKTRISDQKEVANRCTLARY